MRLGALVCFVVLALGATADAQPRRGHPGQARAEAVKKRIRVLRAATLTDELNLDEKALSRLLPVLSKWDDVGEKLLEQRMDIHRRLEAAHIRKDPRAPDSAGGDRAINRLIDEAVANQKAFWSLEEKRLAELRKILTPPQVARLLIVLPAFERKIQNQLRRAMRRGAARGDFDDDEGDFDDNVPPPRRR